MINHVTNAEEKLFISLFTKAKFPVWLFAANYRDQPVAINLKYVAYKKGLRFSDLAQIFATHFKLTTQKDTELVASAEIDLHIAKFSLTLDGSRYMSIKFDMRNNGYTFHMPQGAICSSFKIDATGEILQFVQTKDDTRMTEVEHAPNETLFFGKFGARYIGPNTVGIFDDNGFVMIIDVEATSARGRDFIQLSLETQASKTVWKMDDDECVMHDAGTVNEFTVENSLVKF